MCYGKFPKIGSRKLRSLIHGISCIIRIKLRTRQEHIMEAYWKKLFFEGEHEGADL